MRAPRTIVPSIKPDVDRDCVPAHDDRKRVPDRQARVLRQPALKRLVDQHGQFVWRRRWVAGRKDDQSFGDVDSVDADRHDQCVFRSK